MSKKANLEFNIDAGFREIMSRELEGEDMSLAFVDPASGEVKFRKLPSFEEEAEGLANDLAAAAGKALEEAYPWGYNSGDNEP